MRRVLFDSDVLLDVLAQRQPFVLASAQALNTVTQTHFQVQLGVSVILSIPVHGNRVPTGTLRSLLKDAGLTEEDLG